MKKLLITGLILFNVFLSGAQTDTSKIEQYCQLIATPKLFSNKVSIDIDFGDEKSLWRDGRIKDDNGKIKKFNTIIDALNYMGQQGWIFINTYPVVIGQTTIYYFAFRKQFSKQDFNSSD
jgi:hypothetical protein